MQPARRKRREIMRAFYGLTAVIVLSVAFLMTGMVVWEASERGMRQRVERFHLRSTMLTLEAMRHTSNLQLELSAMSGASPAVVDPVERSNSIRRVQGSLHAIDQAMESIVRLNDAWPDAVDPFAETLGRAVRQIGALKAQTNESLQAVNDLPASAAAFRLTLFQLDRLHGIAAQELLDRIEVTETRNVRRAIALSVVVLLVAGLITGRILLLLRARLQEHERTEQALLERERQLLQASKMEALGSLVGGVAHDFNNLLTAILGQTDVLIGRTAPNDPNADALREIGKAGQRAADLTRQLLVFSRQKIVEPQVIDVNLVIRDIEPMLRRLIRADIVLDFDLGAGVGTVRVDPVQFEQVLVNLAVNARDAMQGAGRLTVRSDRVDAGDAEAPSESTVERYVRIRIEDDGCGMSPEVLSRAFDPFFTTKATGKGTGLGLATVHGIVTKADGFVRAHSEPDRGTRIEVFLPLCHRPADAPAAEVEQQPLRSGSETILVAEDEPQIRRLVVSTLLRTGYEVLEAADGDEALELCAEHPGPVHLILSDVVMPGMGGPEMVRRALALQPSARVVYISGYAESELREDGSLPGDAPMLDKPFKLQDLLQMVRRELDAAEAQGSPAEEFADIGSMRVGR